LEAMNTRALPISIAIVLAAVAQLASAAPPLDPSQYATAFSAGLPHEWWARRRTA
jgi:hypothetical protein